MSPAKRHLLCTVTEVLSGDGGIRNKYMGKPSQHLAKPSKEKIRAT
jgi:hypothetical protein